MLLQLKLSSWLEQCGLASLLVVIDLPLELCIHHPTIVSSLSHCEFTEYSCSPCVRTFVSTPSWLVGLCAMKLFWLCRDAEGALLHLWVCAVVNILIVTYIWIRFTAVKAGGV